jgi:hypothetical protein
MLRERRLIDRLSKARNAKRPSASGDGRTFAILNFPNTRQNHFHQAQEFVSCLMNCFILRLVDIAGHAR